MAGIRVVTGPEWTRFTAGCKSAGDKGLMREVRKDIRSSGKAAGRQVPAEAPEYLPDSYAAELAATMKITTSVTATGVRLKGRASTPGGKSRQLSKLDAGQLRHPLYGRRLYWYPQAVTPGFWTLTLMARKDELGRAVKRAMDRVANRIA